MRPTALVLAPTRELALQVCRELVSGGDVDVVLLSVQICAVVDEAVKAAPRAVARAVGVTCVYGGVDKHAQRDAVKTAAFVVATPGLRIVCAGIECDTLQSQADCWIWRKSSRSTCPVSLVRCVRF
jgi:superfamily II DNA/RNA helicase